MQKVFAGKAALTPYHAWLITVQADALWNDLAAT